MEKIEINIDIALLFLQKIEVLTIKERDVLIETIALINAPSYQVVSDPLTGYRSMSMNSYRDMSA